MTQSKRLGPAQVHLDRPSTRWETIMGSVTHSAHREPLNKRKIVWQKAPFELKAIWALRVRLQLEHRVRELALFNLGIDSKLRGSDLFSLKVRDVCHGGQVVTGAIVMQHKTQRRVQFEITLATREALPAWIDQAELKSEDFLFPSRLRDSPHRGTRQYARILGQWVLELGLDRADYGTHSMRGTKATLIYRRTKNLRAVQLLPGHSKLESTVRYLAIEVEDALEINEKTEMCASRRPATCARLGVVGGENGCGLACYLTHAVGHQPPLATDSFLALHQTMLVPLRDWKVGRTMAPASGHLQAGVREDSYEAYVACARPPGAMDHACGTGTAR